MKDVIAYKDRTHILLLLALLTVCMAVGISIIFINTNLLWLGILDVCASGIGILAFGAVLCFPKTAIVKEGNTLAIYYDLRFGKKIINIDDLVGARVQQSSENGKERKNGAIYLTVKIDGDEKNLSIVGIKNISEVIEKLNALVNSVE